MHRLWAGAAAAVLAALSSAASAAPSVGAQLEAGLRYFDKGQCAKAVPLLEQVRERREFRLLNWANRRDVYLGVAACAGGNDRLAENYVALKYVFETAPRPVDPVSKQPGAVEMLESLAANSPGAVRALDEAIVESVYTYLKMRDAAPDERRRFLSALDHVDWKPRDPLFPADEVWADHAVLLVMAGDEAGAGRALAKIEDPDLLRAPRLDRRFDRIVAADPARFDLRRAAERKLAADLARSIAHPDKLLAATKLAGSYLTLGRPAEALAALDAYVSANHGAGEGANALWLGEVRASALRRLGRLDEAAEPGPAGRPGPKDVSATINLSGRLIRLGRPEEALALLAAVDVKKASPYGRAWIESQSACAYAGLGRAGEAAAHLAWLLEHEAANRRAHVDARLCVDDLEGAAAVYVRWLHDEEDRGAALVALSDGPDLSDDRPGQSERRRRREAVRARPDVQAAIAEAGRTERFDIW